MRQVDVQFFLILHIICGSIALISAAGSSLQKKVENNTLDLENLLSSNDGCSINLYSSCIIRRAGLPVVCGSILAYLVAVGWRLAVNRKGVFTNIDRLLIGFGILAILGLSLSAMDYFSSGENFALVR